MNKTKYLVGAFLATALIVGGCGEDEETTTAPETTTEKLAGQRLTDDNGVEYTLIDNGDGTETARYDDGRSVTFKRADDGSLDYLYGAAGLLAGMAAGYYLFHGFSRPAGTWNAAQNRYTISEPLQRTNNQNTTAPGGSAGKVSSTQNNSSNTSNSANSKVNLSKDNAGTKPAATSSSNSSAKTGFGTAGARGGSSSAAS